jgi:hypothetical protein
MMSKVAAGFLAIVIACSLAQPAYAEKISFKCSGVSYYHHDKKSSARETMQQHEILVVIDLDRGVVTAAPFGPPREIPITKSNDVEVHFGEHWDESGNGVEGSINRITGDYSARITLTGGPVWDSETSLTCKPAKPLF